MHIQTAKPVALRRVSEGSLTFFSRADAGYYGVVVKQDSFHDRTLIANIGRADGGGAEFRLTWERNHQLALAMSEQWHIEPDLRGGVARWSHQDAISNGGLLIWEGGSALAFALPDGEPQERKYFLSLDDAATGPQEGALLFKSWTLWESPKAKLDKMLPLYTCNGASTTRDSSVL